MRELNELCHRHQVEVSTGGFLEFVLTQGPVAVDRSLAECRELGFDLVEISSGFVTLPVDDLIALTRRVQEAGLKAKPDSPSADEPTRTSRWRCGAGRRHTPWAPAELLVSRTKRAPM